MDNQTVVNTVPDENQPQGTATEVTPSPAPGSKTDSELLLKSLQEEREKRRVLEEENLQLRTSVIIEQDAVSDEGKLLEQKIKTVENELREVKQESAKKDLLLAHPELKDAWNDFETFRQDPENKGMNMRTAAKAYMIENGLLDAPRKGLETTTGGTRTPLQTGMTAEDVKNLRTNNPRKYRDMLEKGQIPNLV